MRFRFGLNTMCITSFSTIVHLYHGGQFYSVVKLRLFGEYHHTDNIDDIMLYLVLVAVPGDQSTDSTSPNGGQGCPHCGGCQDIIRKVLSQIKMDTMFGYFPRSLYDKNLLIDFEKELTHCNHYNRQNLSSLPNTPYFSSGS